MNYKEYKQALKNTFSISPCYKIEILDKMENPKEEITSDIISSGSSISVKTNNGIRRTATLVLYNGHNKYKIQPNHIFYGTKLNLYAGISTEKGEYYEQLGVFYIQQISKSNSPADKNLTLTLVDKWAKLDGTVYGKVPSKLAFNKSITVYKEDSPLFTTPEGKTINSAAMKGTDFILDDDISFTEANDGYNNKISLPGGLLKTSTMLTNFTLKNCNFSFKGGEEQDTLDYGNLTIQLSSGNKWMKFYFLEGGTSSITFTTSESDESKKVEYNENLFKSDKKIDFLISNDSVKVKYGDEEAFTINNFLNNFTIKFIGYSSTIKDLIMIGSYVKYYDYNMYDIVRSTLRKSCRYDVKIIDYLPSSVLNFNSSNENDRETINKLLDIRIGLYTIKANYDFIQLSSNNKIFKCISNEWSDSKGRYDPQWEEYFINADDILDNSEPILDAYYEPTYEGDYVKVPNSTELYSKENLPYGLLTLPKSLAQEEGGTEAQILTNIAELLSAEVGYNRFGNFTLKPTDREIDYMRQETIWRFKKDDYYFGSTETINYSNLINYVVVTGTTSDNISLTESAGNYDLESEYCIQKIGVLPYIYKVAYTYNLSDWIPESAKDLSEEEQNAAANEAVKQNMRELAEWYLKRNNSLQTAVEISCYMIPHMEENKIIELENEDGVYNKYVVNSFSIPLDYSGTMTISCTKVG